MGDIEQGFDVVLNHHDCCFVFFVYFFDFRKNFFDDFRRKPKRWFIKKQYFRVGHKSPGQSQHLLLAAGKSPRFDFNLFLQGGENIQRFFQSYF